MNDKTTTATSIAPSAALVAPAKTLPPVPGGGSWRPNAAGDGWVENLPESAPESKTSQTPQILE